VDLDPDKEAIVTIGSKEGLAHLAMATVDRGDAVLVPNPAYPLFDYIARLTHTESRHYRLEEERGWSIDFENLEGQIDSRTKAILIISPNNPTGWVASEEEWKRVGMMAKKYDLAVIHDEVFSEFVFDVGARFPSPKNEGGEPPLQFTLNGISKMFALPSLKLGWIAVSGESKKVAWAMDQLETISDTFLSTHTPIQQALPLLFKEGKQFCEQYKKEVTARRDLAIKILKQSDKIRFVEPRGGFYLMAEVETDLSEEQFVIELMQKTGVFVHPGYFFDYEKESRIVISFLVERERLQKGLTKLVEFLSL
ncbi:MAG: pyridoxal phosphate-dependent aminotransferase, partial [bacterium]|nr:pyridoxal phosphate-dependent aminotransferase [bacterium]